MIHWTGEKKQLQKLRKGGGEGEGELNGVHGEGDGQGVEKGNMSRITKSTSCL